uniref:Saposin B-type domain-containing protein n=1 Tax=Acrobeloides nanus TaxID=290746 RepID=A0A914C410_9BILA
MKAIFILALFIGFALAKENLLKYNKTPKKQEVVEWTSVCDECEQVVQKFAEAAKDPAKMIILKEMLTALCHETDYEEECKIFVSKLDLFIDKLLPYLKNPHAVCQKFHMCSNTRIDRFHRVGVLYAKRYLNKVDGAKDLICEECQFAAHELLQVVDDHNTQVQIHDFISKNVCAHLGQYRGTCDILLDDFLPELFQELHNILSNAKQFCTDLELCTPTQVGLVAVVNMKPSQKFISQILV